MILFVANLMGIQHVTAKATWPNPPVGTELPSTSMSTSQIISARYRGLTSSKCIQLKT